MSEATIDQYKLEQAVKRMAKDSNDYAYCQYILSVIKGGMKVKNSEVEKTNLIIGRYP